jgi:hypothetical protein
LIKEYPLGHGAMAAHQTLDLSILVRIQVPQPELFFEFLIMHDNWQEIPSRSTS